MKRQKYRFFTEAWVFGCCFVLSGFSLAGAETNNNRANFDNFVKNIKIEAIKSHKIPNSVVEKGFQNVTKPLAEILARDQYQPEGVEFFSDYLQRRLNEERIIEGRNHIREKKEILKHISKRYGVPPQYLVALWGLESNFGKNTGNHEIIPALTSLAWEGRRAQFFRKEIFAALKIIEGGHAESLIGSWAGASGHIQMIPSTFLAYGTDWNGDGRKNIWTDEIEALASGANMLAQLGWRKGYHWGRRVNLPQNFDILKYADETRRLSQWRKLGVKNALNNKLINAKPNLKAKLILPEGNQKIAYLVYHNYGRILIWNHSHSFALTVSVFADLLTWREESLPPKPLRKRAEMTSEAIKKAQQALTVLGYAPGPIDGKEGAQTQRALRKWQTYQRKQGKRLDAAISTRLTPELAREIITQSVFRDTESKAFSKDSLR